MKNARLIIVIVGILLPFIARLPGTFIKGKDWLTCYFDGGLAGVTFILAMHALCWGSILLTTLSYKQTSAVWFPAVLGLGFVAIYHAFLDLSSSSTAAIGLLMIPVISLPLVLIGWLLGLWFQK